MTELQSERTETAPVFDEIKDGIRTPRAIRFSESEWKLIKTAATRRGISIGGFVRDAALHHASQQSSDGSRSFSPGIEELIKHTFRYAFFLASIKRDEIIAEGRQITVDDAVERARAAQAELLLAPQNPTLPP